MVTKESLVIHDEADFFWLDKPCQRVADAKYVVGLSATTVKNFEGIEYKWLMRNGIRIYDGHMPPMKELTPDKVKGYTTWLDEKISAANDGLLIYAHYDNLPDICGEADLRGYSDQIINCTDPKVINQVGRRLLIVTPEHYELMRGVDYRNPGACIHLLICHPFPNQRAYD